MFCMSALFVFVACPVVAPGGTVLAVHAADIAPELAVRAPIYGADDVRSAHSMIVEDPDFCTLPQQVLRVHGVRPLGSAMVDSNVVMQGPGFDRIMRSYVKRPKFMREVLRTNALAKADYTVFTGHQLHAMGVPWCRDRESARLFPSLR